jgi:hypothetical protein
MVSAAVVPSRTDAALALVKEGALLVGWVGVVEPPPPPPELAEPPPPPPPPQDPRSVNKLRKPKNLLKDISLAFI